MTSPSLDRATFLALVFTLLACGPVSAQPAATNQPPSSLQPPAPILDNDEMVQLVKVRQQVLLAQPDLKAEEEKLKALHNSAQTAPAPTADQKDAMYAEWKAYQKKMRAAMLKIDPTLTPIFAKLDNARKHGVAPSPFQPATKSD